MELQIEYFYTIGNWNIFNFSTFTHTRTHARTAPLCAVHYSTLPINLSCHQRCQSKPKVELSQFGSVSTKNDLKRPQITRKIEPIGNSLLPIKVATICEQLSAELVPDLWQCVIKKYCMISGGAWLCTEYTIHMLKIVQDSISASVVACTKPMPAQYSGRGQPTHRATNSFASCCHVHAHKKGNGNELESQRQDAEMGWNGMGWLCSNLVPLTATFKYFWQQNVHGAFLEKKKRKNVDKSSKSSLTLPARAFMSFAWAGIWLPKPLAASVVTLAS